MILTLYRRDNPADRIKYMDSRTRIAPERVSWTPLSRRISKQHNEFRLSCALLELLQPI